MASTEINHLANLSFLLDYNDGTSKDEIEYEIFKIAFQSKGEIHYDRSIGGGFLDLEQDPANIASGLLFGSDLIESIFYLNREKNNDPYIVVGYDDITIDDESDKGGAYLVEVQYRLLKDITIEGSVNI